VTVPTPPSNGKKAGSTYARDRCECQFGTPRVRPIKGPYTRDVVLLAFDRNHASALRLLGQILRLVRCCGYGCGVDVGQWFGLRCGCVLWIRFEVTTPVVVEHDRKATDRL